MALTYLADRRTQGDPDPAEVITVILGGKTFRTGRRTAAHITWTIDRLERRHPGANLLILQGSYNTTVDASKGTHDGDGVIDFLIVGLSGDETQRFLRECGWADWHRWPPLFPEHNHAVSLGCPGPVGIYVPGQVEDYLAKPPRSGLAGHVRDTSWHPSDIGSTVFDYPRWLEEQPMTPDDIEKVAQRTAELVLNAKVGNDDTTVKQVLNKLKTWLARS